MGKKTEASLTQQAKDLVQPVFLRDGGQCRYCGEPAESLDHVVPDVLEGPAVLKNLVCACKSCNSRKQGQGGFRLQYDRRRGPSQRGTLRYRQHVVSRSGIDALWGDSLWDYVEKDRADWRARDGSRGGRPRKEKHNAQDDCDEIKRRLPTMRMTEDALVLAGWLAERFGAVAVEADHDGSFNYYDSDMQPHNYDLRQLTRLKTLRILVTEA